MSGSGLAKNMVRISQEEFCDLLEHCQVQQTLDLGTTLLHTARHEAMGLLVLVNDLAGSAAYLPL